MNKNRGFGLFDALLFLALATLLFLWMYGASRVPSEEITRLTNLASSHPRVSQEWKEFLFKNPTPTQSEITKLRGVIETAAVLKEAEKATGKPVESSKIQSYFDDKLNREREQTESQERDSRLQRTPFWGLALIDKAAWIVYGNGLIYALFILLIYGLLMVAGLWLKPWLDARHIAPKPTRRRRTSR